MPEHNEHGSPHHAIARPDMCAARDAMRCDVQVRALEADMSSVRDEASKAMSNMQRSLATSQKQRAELEAQMATLK